MEVLKKAGFAARKPKGSFFLYVKAPKAAAVPDGKRVEFKNAEDSRPMADHGEADLVRAVG